MDFALYVFVSFVLFVFLWLVSPPGREIEARQIFIEASVSAVNRYTLFFSFFGFKVVYTALLGNA